MKVGLPNTLIILIVVMSFLSRVMNTLSENLRYVDFIWKSKHNLTPRYLTVDDVSLIENPKYLFARKFTANSVEFFKRRIQE